MFINAILIHRFVLKCLNEYLFTGLLSFYPYTLIPTCRFVENDKTGTASRAHRGDVY